jgi:Cu/Ag efflux protein CusF
MHDTRLHRLAAIALAFAFLACGGGPPGTPKPGHGVIRGLRPEGAEVTIEHGEIPDLMMAMTMTFSVDDPTLLEGIAVGDEVDFLAKRDGERYVVTQIRRKAD